MTAQPCSLCGATVEDAYVCRGCARRLEIELGDIPALVVEIETVLTRQTTYSEQAQRVSGGRAVPVPFHIPAGLARANLHAILATWCRLVHVEHHAETRRDLPDDRPSAMAGWLMHEVEWLRHHACAAEAINEITDAARAARRVLDAPANRTTFPLGPCPVAECGGEVRAYIPRDEANPCHADCSVDPLHTWDSTQFLGLGKRMLHDRERIGA